MNIPHSRYKARAERLTLAPDAAISVEARAGTELRSLDYHSIADLKRAARLARSREVARLVKCGWAWLARTFRYALGGEASRVAAARPHAGCGS